MDFTKTFDKGPHNLLHKLQSLKYTIKNILWLQDFLQDRSQAVSYSNCISSSAEVQSGVPHETSRTDEAGPPHFFLQTIHSSVTAEKK